jgi:hypothetical protein
LELEGGHWSLNSPAAAYSVSADEVEKVGCLRDFRMIDPIKQFTTTPVGIVLLVLLGSTHAANHSNR